MTEKAIVLLSGGMDSVVALYWATHSPWAHEIHTLFIDYGQRMNVQEKNRARFIAERARSQYPDKHKSFKTVTLPPACLAGPSSLLHRADVDKYETVADTIKPGHRDASYIPLRNGVFAAIAANHLLALDDSGGWIVSGMRGASAKAATGFADGSEEFQSALANAFSIGSRASIVIVDPFGDDRTRVGALALAEKLPGCWEALSNSWSCFVSGVRPCGECLPCVRRKKAFADFGKPDPAAGELWEG